MFFFLLCLKAPCAAQVLLSPSDHTTTAGVFAPHEFMKTHNTLHFLFWLNFASWGHSCWQTTAHVIM